MTQRKISSPVLMAILLKAEGVGRKMEHYITLIQRYAEPALTSVSGTKKMDAVLLPCIRAPYQRIFVSDDLKLRVVDRDKYFVEALKMRKDIERKFGEVKSWYGLRRAQYRGKWRVTIQVLMTFIVVNIKRMVKIFREDLNKVPYSSVICALPKQVYCSELALEIGQ